MWISGVLELRECYASGEVNSGMNASYEVRDAVRSVIGQCDEAGDGLVGFRR